MRIHTHGQSRVWAGMGCMVGYGTGGDGFGSDGYGRGSGLMFVPVQLSNLLHYGYNYDSTDVRRALDRLWKVIKVTLTVT